MAYRDMRWIGHFILLLMDAFAYGENVYARDNVNWYVYGDKEYLFVMDADRDTDQTLAGAYSSCTSLRSRLISIETAEEMSFVKGHLVGLQEEMGQHSVADQWWTSGMAHNGTWVWNNGHYSPITIKELKRSSIPVRRPLHQLVLKQSDQSWRLHPLKENYKLRYICERPLVEHSAPNIIRTTEERLLDRLFYNYDVDARGVAKVTDTLTVKIAFYLVRIQDLDERKQVLTTMGLIVTEWVDLRLQWDATNYHNISSIAVHSNRIWLPELTVMNGVEEQVVDSFERMRAVVEPSGVVHWEPGGVFQTTCDMDITYFPFDTQKCTVQVGTWAYYSLKMNLSADGAEVNLSDFRLNGEWEIIKTSISWGRTVLPCCENLAYPHVSFIMHLQRRRVYYVINIVVPCSMLSLLMLMMFWVPQHAGERVTGIVTVLLAFTVFLHMLSSIVPRTSLQIPIIVIYLACTMSLGTLSVCLTIVLMHLYHNCPTTSPPSFILPWIHARLEKSLAVHSKNDKEVSIPTCKDREGKKYHLQSSLKSETRYVSPIVTPDNRHQNQESRKTPALSRNSISRSEQQTTLSREGSPVGFENDARVTKLKTPDVPVQYSRGFRVRTKESPLRMGKSEKILRFADAQEHEVSPEDSETAAVSSSDDEVTEKVMFEHSCRDEWLEVVKVLDRIFFLFVTIAMVATALFLFLMPLYNRSNLDD